MYRCTAHMQNANAFTALPRDSLAHWPCRTQKHAGSEQRVPVTAALHAFCVKGCCPASDMQVRQKELHRPRSIRDFLKR